MPASHKAECPSRRRRRRKLKLVAIIAADRVHLSCSDTRYERTKIEFWDSETLLAIVATVSPRSRGTGGGDTAAAMGSCQVGSALSLFSLWWSLRRWLLSFPERLPRRAMRGLGEHRPQRLRFGCFLWSVSSSSSGRVFSPRAICYPQAHQQRDWRLHHDLFGSGRGTSTLNLQIEFFGRAQRRCRGCAVPKGFAA